MHHSVYGHPLCLDAYPEEPPDGVPLLVGLLQCLGEGGADGILEIHREIFAVFAFLVEQRDLEGDFLARLIGKPFVEECLAVVRIHEHLEGLHLSEAEGALLVVRAADLHRAVDHLERLSFGVLAVGTDHQF